MCPGKSGVKPTCLLDITEVWDRRIMNMMNRRMFLKAGLVPPASTCFFSSKRTTSAENSRYSENPPVDQTHVTHVPDTLDLAHRGALGINGILGSLDPRLD